MKYSTAFSGKKPFSSAKSWAASVLLWERMSVGRFQRAMRFAIVNVLPLPVTPWRTRRCSSASSPLTSASIASGWSPVGLKSETSLKSRSAMRAYPLARSRMNAARRSTAILIFASEVA